MLPISVLLWTAIGNSLISCASTTGALRNSSDSGADRDSDRDSGGDSDESKTRYSDDEYYDDDDYYYDDDDYFEDYCQRMWTGKGNGCKCWESRQCASLYCSATDWKCKANPCHRQSGRPPGCPCEENGDCREDSVCDLQEDKKQCQTCESTNGKPNGCPCSAMNDCESGSCVPQASGETDICKNCDLVCGRLPDGCLCGSSDECQTGSSCDIVSLSDSTKICQVCDTLPFTGLQLDCDCMNDDCRSGLSCVFDNGNPPHCRIPTG